MHMKWRTTGHVAHCCSGGAQHVIPWSMYFLCYEYYIIILTLITALFLNTVLSQFLHGMGSERGDNAKFDALARMQPTESLLAR